MKQKMVWLCALTGLFVQAATWTGGGDGTSWSDPANWGGQLPGTAERCFRDPCTSTGELYVVSGTLVLAAPGAALYGVDQTASTVLRGGSWAGPKVQISGGTLKANHAKAFTRTVDFDLQILPCFRSCWVLV